jgi:hypothetical protein
VFTERSFAPDKQMTRSIFGAVHLVEKDHPSRQEMCLRAATTELLLHGRRIKTHAFSSGASMSVTFA